MNYETTKQFTDWLKKVRPEFEIQSEWVMYQPEDLTYSVQIDCDTEYYISDFGTLNSLGRNKNMIAQTIAEDWCYEISTDLLHDILWELFDVEYPDNPKARQDRMHKYTGDDGVHVSELNVTKTTIIDTFIPETIAEFLWARFTYSKDSLWRSNPDQVLKDIMKTYKELNQ